MCSKKKVEVPSAFVSERPVEVLQVAMVERTTGPPWPRLSLSTRRFRGT